MQCQIFLNVRKLSIRSKKHNEGQLTYISGNTRVLAVYVENFKGKCLSRNN